VFDKKKGYCEYFATATTLLLRLAGVPARYVTGYALRPFQRVGDHYVVRDSDAHAWAEAYLPGRGWVEVDATPAADYEAVHAGQESNGLFARLQAAYDEVVAFVSQGGARGLARVIAGHPGLTGLSLFGLAAFLGRRRLRKRRPASRRTLDAPSLHPLSPQMQGLLKRIDALCVARGSSRLASRGPREHVVDPKVGLTDDERAACLEAVQGIYAEAYGGCPVSARDFARMLARLDALGRPSPVSR
jgi:hypothetical protein